MSDIKGVELSDVFGLSKPLMKLIEVVSAGIGKVYEPSNIRRLACAEADKIAILGDAITQNPQVTVNYSDDKITITDPVLKQLWLRAQKRLVFQEIKKQQNIESIIAFAYRKLENDKEVSSGPVDPDWISNFFDNAGNISNEQMQLLWSQILAGEVRQTNSFSIRTVNALKSLTVEEAKVFEEISSFVINDRFIPAHFLSDNHIGDNEIMLSLVDAGLMQVDEGKLCSSKCQTFALKIFSKNNFVILHSNCPRSFLLVDRFYYLTKAGMELLQLLERPPFVSQNYCIYIATKFKCNENEVTIGDFKENNIDKFESKLKHEIGLFAP